ncbi:TonB system transport protein ExbD [Paracoccus aerodenitrificans]|uniref:TonB system transport protein ExbD n=1 Tax=Paracoccus aerodenitrificans TaxID=3017781 RepID=UPI0022F0BD66|nr:TonB system transport protein ExbD [Paracoccus aerodenitrificans]WBU63019.1 TonB system transport protein ExbD [Paracoccus aerodenitrificans]
MAGRMQEGDSLEENHEINVTPFIDVMLVLLIIFMVAAPLATVDINVDLPTSRGSASERPDEPVWLTVSSDLTMTLGNEPVPPGQLRQSLEAGTDGDRETRIFLRADKSVSYGEVMDVMNSMRDAAYTKIALVGMDGNTAGAAADAAQADGAAAPVTASAPAAEEAAQ